jgi:hypothetical protein
MVASLSTASVIVEFVNVPIAWAACRLCNQGRFRLSEEHFRAELLSLAKSVSAIPIRR